MLRLQKFLQIFFVEECLHCRASGEILCEQCLTSIPKEPLRKVNPERKIVTINLSAFPWVHSPLLYRNQILQKSIYYLKYHHTQSIAKYLAQISYEDFYNFLARIAEEKSLPLEQIIFLPIPISKKRELERDYNQSEILLREILNLIRKSKGFDLQENLRNNLLLKVRHTIKFAHTHSQETRQELIEGAFSVTPNFSAENFRGKIFLLFDDVTTTGATFYEARKTLINSGIPRENIYAYALAH